MWRQSRQMNENISAKGMPVMATMMAVRTLKRNMPSTTSTSSMPRRRFFSTVCVVSSISELRS